MKSKNVCFASSLLNPILSICYGANIAIDQLGYQNLKIPRKGAFFFIKLLYFFNNYSMIFLRL